MYVYVYVCMITQTEQLLKYENHLCFQGRNYGSKFKMDPNINFIDDFVDVKFNRKIRIFVINL